MAKKLYDYDYVLNLEYEVKLLQEIADSQKKNIKLPKKEYQTARGEKGFLDAKIYASNWHTHPK